MGVYNNSDWLLNQIRGTANVVSKAFKFETLDIEFRSGWKMSKGTLLMEMTTLMIC